MRSYGGSMWALFIIFSTLLLHHSVTNGGQIFTDSTSTFQSYPHQQQQQHFGSISVDEDDRSLPPSDPETAEARERCSFPVRWEGNWFQSGFHQTLTITRHGINAKGKCLEADGEKFVVYNERENCYRCLVFHEKHQNVLQYKETFCIPERRPLRNMCSTITGDANLFSMFRLEANPMECPFRGPFTFAYNRGHGDCRYPVSTIDSCLHPSRLLLNYQACPDIPGTESTVEQLECLATWKEGSSRYLLGLIDYRHPASYEDRFRCFLYEKIKKDRNYFPGANYHHSPVLPLIHGNNSDILYRVAQSGDATCNGLTPQEGSRILTLRRAPVPKTCQFPSWLTSSRQSWYTLDERRMYYFENSELRVTNVSGKGGGGTGGGLSMTAVCSQIQENPTLDKVLLVLHSVSDCRSGFICMAIYRRENHIIELQIGNLSRRLEDACTGGYYEPNQQPFITLISSTVETRQCPNLGQYEVSGLMRNGRQLADNCAQGFNSMSVGCNSLDTLQFRSDCSSTDVIAEYSCNGWWEEMGTSYLITTPLSRSSTSSSVGGGGQHRRVCFIFRENPQFRAEKYYRQSSNFYDETGGGSVGGFSSESPTSDLNFYGRFIQFSTSPDSCHRHFKLGSDGSLAFNVTSQGRCNGLSSGGVAVMSAGLKIDIIIRIVIMSIIALLYTAQVDRNY